MPTTCPVEWVESEHPLFLLYTSGSTGGCHLALGLLCMLFEVSLQLGG